MSVVYIEKLFLIFVLSVCINIFEINCDCCCYNSCKGNNSNGGDIKKIIIKVTSESITIDGKILNKLEKDNKPQIVVNDCYLDSTDIYDWNSIGFNNNYEIVIENESKNKPYIIAIVEVENDDEKIEHYIVSCLDNVSKGFFRNRGKIKSVVILESKNVTNMSYMFDGCSSLKVLDLSKFNSNNVTNMSCVFSECSSLKELDLNNFNTSNVTDMSCIFDGCSSLKELNLSSFNTSNVTNMSHMFHGCSLLKYLDINNFNTNNVTFMDCMFDRCSSLTNINLNNINTSNVTDMSYMFNECSSLQELNLNNFNTKNVTNMFEMFYECKLLELKNVIVNDKKIINILSNKQE